MGQQRMQSQVTLLLILSPGSLSHHVPVRPPSIGFSGISDRAPIASQQLHHPTVHVPPITPSNPSVSWNGLAPVWRKSTVFWMEFLSGWIRVHRWILKPEHLMLVPVIEEVIHHFLAWVAENFKFWFQRLYIYIYIYIWKLIRSGHRNIKQEKKGKKVYGV